MSTMEQIISFGDAFMGRTFLQNRSRDKIKYLGKVFLQLSLLFVLFFSFSLSTQAAWKQNTDGTFSYYNSAGVLQKNKWINNTYYVDRNGIRIIGKKIYTGGKWYCFDKNGKVIKKKWIKSGNKRMRAQANGSLCASGRYKIGSAVYLFDNKGFMLTGLRTVNDKTYYFSTSTGKMLTSTKLKLQGSYYYFNAKGVMAVSKWITNSKKEKIYYATSDGSLLCSATKTEDGKTYTFNASGKVTSVKTTTIPKATCSVQSTYYTDPYADDETLLAAIIYCEAGNQTYAGQMAVGMVVMNRKYSSAFAANTVREVIYATEQFTPASNGALTQVMNDPGRITDSAAKAAKAVLEKYENYKSGQTVKLKLDNGKSVAFPYLFFMTTAAYQRLGLTASYRQIGAHRFFTTWS